MLKYPAMVVDFFLIFPCSSGRYFFEYLEAYLLGVYEFRNFTAKLLIE
jgi:hypothetical protein